MFDIDLDDLDADDAAKAGQGLESEEFTVRRDACKALGDLSDFSKAEPFILKLKELSMEDPDYEVKKAAKRAYASLREKGVKLPASGSGSAENAPPKSLQEVAMVAYTGPRLLVRIFKEVLPMRVEGDVTASDVTEIWEKVWGVQYAGRLKFEGPHGNKLNPREDILPRSPAVVTLHAGSGSIMGALASAMKLYGLLSEAEFAAEQERRLEQQQGESQRRQQADRREQERWRQAEEQRVRRMAGLGNQVDTTIPFVKKKALGGHLVAGL